MHTLLLVLSEERVLIQTTANLPTPPTPSCVLYPKLVPNHSAEMSYFTVYCTYCTTNKLYYVVLISHLFVVHVHISQFPHHLDMTLNLSQRNQKLWSECWRGMENKGRHLHFPKETKEGTSTSPKSPATSCCAPATATEDCHYLPLSAPAFTLRSQKLLLE